MDQTLTLSSGVSININEEFPPLNSGSKATILFTGGVDSTLILLIAKQKYGVENLSCILHTFDDTQNFRNNKPKLERVKKDFYDAVSRHGVSNFCELSDSDSYIFGGGGGTSLYYDVVLKKSIEEFGDTSLVFGGWGIIQHEHIKLLTDSGWDRGLITRDDVYTFLRDNRHAYPNIIKHVDVFKGDVYFVKHLYGFEHVKSALSNTIRPWRNLNSYDVYELYYLLGFEDELHRTVSCNNGEHSNHCGTCKNCAERKYNFRALDKEDLTLYSDD